MSTQASILVLRGDDEFSEMLRSAGLSVINMPMIESQPLADQAELRRVLGKLSEYEGLIFTSPVAAKVFVQESADRLTGSRATIYAMGRRANTVLRNAGLETVFSSDICNADDLIAARAKDFEGKRLLFVRGNKSMRVVPDRLKGLAIVDEVVVYRTINARPDPDDAARISRQISTGEIEWLCFFSPSAIDAFGDTFGKSESIKAAAIGSTTANRAAELGFNVGFVSSRASSADFAEEFISHLNGN